MNQLNSAYEGGMNSVASVIVVMAYDRTVVMNRYFHVYQATEKYQEAAVDGSCTYG